MSKERVAVMDADIFVYKVAQAAMREVMFDEYCISIGDKAEAIVALDNWFTSVCTKINADRMILAFTGSSNYRKIIWPEYKTHRKDKKPYLVKELRDYCESNTKYNCITVDNLEADDLVGKFMTKPSKDIEYIGVSEDKDLCGVPGALFNPAKDTLIQRTDFGDAVEFFYNQVLTGDTSDGYKGVPGCGPVKAAKYIGEARRESEGDWEFITKGWETIVKVYEKSGLGFSEAQENASMAKILWYKEEAGEFNKFKLQDYWRKIKNAN